MCQTVAKPGRISWDGSRTNKRLENHKQNSTLLMQSENENSEFAKCRNAFQSNAIRSNVEDCLSLTSHFQKKSRKQIISYRKGTIFKTCTVMYNCLRYN